MSKIFTKDGQKYVKIGDRAIPFADYDENGKPIIIPKIEITKHKNGRRDVKIKIPNLRIKYNTNG